MANNGKKANTSPELQKKWTKPLMDAGWTVLPSVILERQRALGLDALDINILLHLAKHWWKADELPYPSKRSIAECIGVDPRTVQRRIAAMEHDGLIKRGKRSHPVYGQQSNEYSFAGLIESAEPYAREKLKERESGRESRAKKRTKKSLTTKGSK